MTEIQAKLRDFIWETNLQKMTRLDQEYQALCQGGMNHAEFRVLFESKLQDMAECTNYEVPMESVLYRNYLCKLRQNLKSEVLRKEWKLDGPTNPPRPMATWRDVAKAVGLLLEERSDIDAARVAVGNSIMNLVGVKAASVPLSRLSRILIQIWIGSIESFGSWWLVTAWAVKSRNLWSS